MNHEEIANQINDLKENIVLIYAFNSTGKTRLSVTFKNITKNDETSKHSGVYYNAFSEDLFVWDNDGENNEENVKLQIHKSALNKLHSSIIEDDIREILIPYKVKFDFFFNSYSNLEDGIESISFYVKGEEKMPIKISRGEERIFVWCFFLTLFEVEGWSDIQNSHFFIDDPVSSLDDNNIFITASKLFDLIEQHFESRKIIVTSHHFGFISILSNWISKGEKAGKFINRDKSKKYKQFILTNESNELKLINPKNGVFLYHLRLLQGVHLDQP